MSKAKRSYSTAKTPKELGSLLGLSDTDVALMKFKADLTSLAVKKVNSSKLTLNEIVKLSGVARSKVLKPADRPVQRIWGKAV